MRELRAVRSACLRQETAGRMRQHLRSMRQPAAESRAYESAPSDPPAGSVPAGDCGDRLRPAVLSAALFPDAALPKAARLQPISEIPFRGSISLPQQSETNAVRVRPARHSTTHPPQAAVKSSAPGQHQYRCNVCGSLSDQSRRIESRLRERHWTQPAPVWSGYRADAEFCV